MKNVFLSIFIVLILISLGVIFLIRNFLYTKKTNRSALLPVSITPSPIEKNKDLYVFVPYWKLESGNTAAIEGVTGKVIPIYFGISTQGGILDKNDRGYVGIDRYLSENPIPGWLTLAITNDQEAQYLMDDIEKMESLFSSVAILAKKSGFEGVLIDLEVGFANTPEIQSQINQVFASFADITKKHGLLTISALYGDTLYRPRPYDLTTIGKLMDKVLVMNYDFHKPDSVPGPNFPLKGKNKYGYDLVTQVAEFSNLIEKSKLIYTFGMYGYDWLVTIDKKPLKKASSLSLVDIRDLYLANCPIENCLVSRDALSREQEVSVVDKNNQYHLVWFEDEISVKEKINFLQSEEINQFAFWAKGYY